MLAAEPTPRSDIFEDFYSNYKADSSENRTYKMINSKFKVTDDLEVQHNFFIAMLSGNVPLQIEEEEEEEQKTINKAIKDALVNDEYESFV